MDFPACPDSNEGESSAYKKCGHESAGEVPEEPADVAEEGHEDEDAEFLHRSFFDRLTVLV